MFNSLWPRELQHTRLPCLSLAPEVCSNSCSSNQWCHPTISSSVIPFSSSPPSFLASGSFPMSQFFTSGGQSIGALASASVLPMNIQDWSPLGWTGLISWQSKGLSREETCSLCKFCLGFRWESGFPLGIPLSLSTVFSPILFSRDDEMMTPRITFSF